MSKAWLLTLLLSGCCTPMPSSAFVLHTRSRAGAEVVEQTVSWEPERTAIIVCDMWDDHWCAGAARRVGELAVPMNAMLAEARSRGAFIIHAPSSVVSFYEDTPQRTRAQQAAFSKTPVPLSQEERWGTNWCWPDPDREPDMPIDDSDMGCDCDTECELREAWTSQHATLQLPPLP